jgi:15-cis-phytoene synthase
MRSTVAPADLAACTRLLRAGSKSFSTASLLLPRRVRAQATVVYAFCRVADDAIDSEPGTTAAAVDALRARLARAYAGAPDDDPVDRALAAVVADARVPRELFEALLEGFAWDVEDRHYETLDEVYAYAARVAGAVGAIMAVVMGRRAPSALARACDLGVAMQLTNIARDVGEDAARGRLYLPRAWLRAIVARLLDAADVLYRRADRGIAALPADCRVAIRAARLIYSDIGRAIAAAGYDSVTRRAVVSKGRKLWLLVRALRPRLGGRPDAAGPPLDAVVFLVEACRSAS